MKYVIGIDPDSRGVPCAIYEDGKLVILKVYSLIQLYLCVKNLLDEGHAVEFHVENLKAISCSSFSWKRTDNQKVRAKKSEHVGMCKQSQTEVENLAKELGIKVVHYGVSRAWKSASYGKPQFRKLTNWKGRSNEDTRSAAYFGFLGCK